MEDLSPRIKTSRTQINELEESKVEIGGYVQDLKKTLEEDSFAELKWFLKSFINRIEYNSDDGGKIEYHFPLVPTGLRNLPILRFYI